MPLAYGGGIRTAADARTLFGMGVEKVCLQSAAMHEPGHRPGDRRQRRAAGGDRLDRRQEATGSASGRSIRPPGLKPAHADWREAVKAAAAAGAGEILLNAVDRDGTLAGIDAELIAKPPRMADVPLIAVGGVGGAGRYQGRHRCRRQRGCGGRVVRVSGPAPRGADHLSALRRAARTLERLIPMATDPIRPGPAITGSAPAA